MSEDFCESTREEWEKIERSFIILTSNHYADNIDMQDFMQR
ncbi:hypothetical protein [Neobacillus bataviensis]|nr:hypothetical protein [Neobacillus bataviensis]